MTLMKSLKIDLRNKEIPIDQRDSVFGKLQSSFGSGILGIRHKELDNTDAQHFHFQLASRGFNGIVGKDGPRGFIVGEAGEELVTVQPLVSPSDKMNAMNALNTENQTARGGQSGPIIVNTNATSNTSTNPTNLIMDHKVRGKPLVTSRV